MTAQTPVESLMSGFDERKGVNVLIAEGGMMTVARGYIRKSPMGPLADSVDEVTILTMKRASDQGIKTVVIGGSVKLDDGDDMSEFDAVYPTTPPGMPLEEAMRPETAAENIRTAIAEIMNKS